jgi:murein DD-endopeptidase MepM/ murein hydrolase activator NlpD
MNKDKRYTIMVVSEQAGCRQFSISRRGLAWAAASIVIVIAGLIFTSFQRIDLSALESVDQKEFDDLRKENEELKLANDRYLEASKELERKIRVFDEKATKLARFVGVEPVEATSGIGGPDLLENELNRYLRYDLGLLETKAGNLDERFDSLETAFRDQAELLDSTPSTIPARGWISSGYSYRIDPFTKQRTFHPGLDVSCPEGTPIYAPANGVISFKGYKGGFGNMLAINHGNGIKTRYAHLYKFNVSKGQRVSRGDLIGYVGSTGRSTAPHLHYEVHKDGKSVDPMKYIIRDAKTF